MSEVDDLLAGLPVEDPKVKEEPVVFNKETTESDKVKEKRGRKVGSSIEGQVVSYTGPLQVFTLNEFKFPEGYSPVILTFKEFIEKLGADGVTFEDLFTEAEKAYQEKGIQEAEVSKIKQKFAAINNKNTLTFKTIELIAGLLGYEPVISFKRTSVPTIELSNNIQSLDD